MSARNVFALIVFVASSITGVSAMNDVAVADPVFKGTYRGVLLVAKIPRDQGAFHIDAVYQLEANFESWEYGSDHRTCEIRVQPAQLTLQFMFFKAGFPLANPHLPQQPPNVSLSTLPRKGFASDCGAVAKDSEREKYAYGTGDKFPSGGLPTLLPIAVSTMNSAAIQSARVAYEDRLFEYIQTLP